MTHLIRSLTDVPTAFQAGIVTLGNFDGVHLGHQHLILSVVKRAKALGLPAVLITFEPHPFEFFSGENLTTPRITRFREKFERIRELGIDAMVVLKFNQALANCSASDFATRVLVDALKAKHVIIGDDFHFGKNRQGNLALLQQLGQFQVEAMPTFLLGEARVSSTRVREALKQSDLDEATRCLGRPFTLTGKVRHGQKLARQWGVPTANIFLHRRLTPVKGVFNVRVHGLGDKPVVGVANVGTRPTVDGTRTVLEVHCHDFNRDIYGKVVEVEFCKKLREEVRFESLEALKAQILADVAMSRDYFKRQTRDE